MLVSLSCVLQIAESLIPHPIPGLRLGLANVITLITLVTMGFGCALEITAMRTIVGSFIMGTFMSPAFILSFSAGLISTIIMGFLYWLSSFHNRYRLSIVGISIAGALSHNTVQLYLAYRILIKHKGIFVFFPWLCIGAVIMGWLTGVIAGRVCLKLRKEVGMPVARKTVYADYSRTLRAYYLPGGSLIHRIPGHIKIVAVSILSLTMLLSNSLWLHFALFVFLAMAMAVSQSTVGFYLSGIRKYSSMVFVSFLLPVFFNSGKHVLSHIHRLNITSEGLNSGLIFVLRVVFLILLSSLLARTTSPKELSRGLARLLSPFRCFGVSGERVAIIFSYSWGAVPVFWDMARGILRRTEIKKVKNFANLVPILCDFIAGFYLEAENYKDESDLRKEANF